VIFLFMENILKELSKTFGNSDLIIIFA
jgi:hypothetical protein